MTMTLSTGVPDSFAATGLAPAARICRPSSEYLNRTNSEAPTSEGHDQQRRVVAVAGLAQAVEGGGKFAERLGLREDQHRPEEQAGRRQGDDEAVDSRAHDQDAVNPAEGGADSQPADDRDDDRQAEAFEQVSGDHDGADADRSDGEVHATGRQDDHHGEADHRVDGKVPRQREQVERREETGGETGNDRAISTRMTMAKPATLAALTSIGSRSIRDFSSGSAERRVSDIESTYTAKKRGFARPRFGWANLPIRSAYLQTRYFSSNESMMSLAIFLSSSL